MYSKNTVCLIVRFLQIIMLSIILANSTFAGINSRYANWLGTDVSGPFKANRKLYYDISTQARIPTNPTRLEQHILQPSIYYQLDHNWSLWLGYDMILNRPSIVSSLIEQRVWPQIEYDKELSNHLLVSVRSRFENRWLERNPGLSIRLRQRLEFSFVKWNRYDIDFDVFDEMFFGLKKPLWVTNNSLDQNRLFLGFVIPINNNVNVETGYLNIFRPRSIIDRVDHILLVALALNISQNRTVPIRTV